MAKKQRTYQMEEVSPKTSRRDIKTMSAASAVIDVDSALNKDTTQDLTSTGFYKTHVEINQRDAEFSENQGGVNQQEEIENP